MYLKTSLIGTPITLTGDPENKVEISDATVGSAVDITINLEPFYSGSGTPSLINIRPISGQNSAGVTNGYEDDTETPDMYYIEFGDPAVSVYGGTLEVSTGTLTVTKVAEVVTTVTARGVFGDNRRFAKAAAYHPKVTSSEPYCICDRIESSYRYAFSHPENANGRYVTVGRTQSLPNIYIVLPSSEADTLAEARSWMATNRPTVCYEIDTPIVYHIDPTTIKIHEGLNKISASGDSFSVTYSDRNVKYTNIRNIQFAPETDVTSSEIVINEFTVDIKTQDTFVTGRDAYLCDNHDNVWAKFGIYSADRTSTDIVQLNAKSTLWKLENRTMYQSMYFDEPVSTVISRIFRDLDAEYVLDSSFDNVTITGYLPQGSARERLHQVCFTIGAYIKTTFTDKVEILPVDTTVTSIPASKVYWRPSVEYSNYITSVQVVYYNYEERYPDVVDEWVEVNGKYYVKTAKTAELKNPNAPADAPENVAKVDDIGIINVNNVDEVLTRLAQFYFQRIQLTADVVDNGEYQVGEKYAIPTGINAEYPMITGFMNSAAFTFGHQAKARITISQSEEVNAVDVIIVYEINGQELDSEMFTVPEGYHFSFENPFIARSWYVGYSVTNDVYRPVNDYAEGTAETGLTHREEYVVALEQVIYSGENTLYINEVDDLEYTTADDVNTLTIKGGENA